MLFRLEKDTCETVDYCHRDVCMLRRRANFAEDLAVAMAEGAVSGKQRAFCRRLARKVRKEEEKDKRHLRHDTKGKRIDGKVTCNQKGWAMDATKGDCGQRSFCFTNGVEASLRGWRWREER
ncbi:hypothetical protein GOP47_0006714 [Adiantum capillus-veneris]|uniref:Uncharacterized protein n=1 Tax=Adiantum capillus-veneris TaxID=13818 RepID=A0A9D4ZKI9_ADICA|nr:hypothetical protein GOP47_0006714 [Adiantum capillus-veneris]